MRSFIIVLLTAKIGFICHEAVTSLKLLEKGFSKEDMALSVLLDFPLQILFGYYAAKWSNGPRPLKPVSIDIQACVVCNLNFKFLFVVVVCILWSVGVLSCRDVDCVFLPRGQARYRAFLFWSDYGVDGVEFVHVDGPVCQHFCVHD